MSSRKRPQEREHRPGYVYVVLVAGLLSISVSAILIRWASEAPGETLAVWRTLFAAAMLAPFAVFKSRKEIASFTMREGILITIAGIFLGLHFVTWISSLFFTSVASASVLVSLSPIFLALAGLLFLNERPTRAEVWAIIIATLGTILLGYSDMNAHEHAGSNPLLGNTFALSAALLVTVYLLIGRVIRQSRSWLAYVAPLYVVTAMTTFVVAWMRDVPLLGFDWEVYALCMAMAVVPQLMGHGALNFVVRYFPAATIGLASLFEPIGASLLAFVFFSEVPTLLGIGAMAVILLSVSLALFPRK